MFSRSPTFARVATIIFVLWACLAQLISAQQPAGPTHGPEVICKPFGTCEPCPEDALHQPFCKPFGNRRLMHCTIVAQTPTPPPTTRPNVKVPPLHHLHTSHAVNADTHFVTQGETPAWESCGRIPDVERADFWEFVACNVALAVISLFVLFARSKRLQALRGRQLAARIGLVSGGSRS